MNQQLESTKRIEIYSEIVDDIVQNANSLVITDLSAARDAVAYACKARDVCDKIDLARKEITKQARDFTAEVNDFAKKFTEPLKKVAEIIKEKIDNFKAQQIEESSVMSIMSDVPVLTYDDMSKIRSREGSLSEQTIIDYEVTDLNIVPRQFLMVNDALVKQSLKDGNRNIPGMRIITSSKTVLRRR